jgi:glucose/arabinose dehydrogenase
VITALLLLGGGAGSAAAGSEAPVVGNGRGGVELKLLGSFDRPVYAETAPGRANRKLLFVVEQGGVVRVLRRNRTLRKPFLDISDKVQPEGEQGLLSIAFDPEYASNRRLYAYFTDSEGDIRVSQFRRRKDSRTQTTGRPRKVIEIPHREAGNHNGGTVAFGPDGLMYLGTGDGGSGCDPPGNAQDRDSLLGKLLRIEPRRKRGYRIPADNPFAETAGRDEIYSLGLRNPYRFSFDEQADAIAIGDVGQSALEEVDYLRLGAARGANFGWDRFEGTELAGCGNDDGSPTRADHVGPIHQYGHDGPGYTGCSITGGSVARDPKLETLYGRYVFADFCNGRLRSLIPAADGARDERSVGVELDGPTALVNGRRGRLYATALSGGLYRLLAAG